MPWLTCCLRPLMSWRKRPDLATSVVERLHGARGRRSTRRVDAPNDCGESRESREDHSTYCSKRRTRPSERRYRDSTCAQRRTASLPRHGVDRASLHLQRARRHADVFSHSCRMRHPWRHDLEKVSSRLRTYTASATATPAAGTGYATTGLCAGRVVGGAAAAVPAAAGSRVATPSIPGRPGPRSGPRTRR